MLIILLILFIVLLYFSITSYLCNEVKSYTYSGNTKGRNVLIVGGTHGNEPAGTVALQQLKNNIKTGKITIKSGNLTIIPKVNYCGLNLGIRWNPGTIFNPDINRNYPTSSFYKENNEAKCNITKNITKIVDTSDFILDLHEGYDFHRRDSKSMGSAIFPSLTEEAKNVAEKIKNNINKSIVEDYKKFDILLPSELPGTLSDYCANKNYILIETSGQNNIQDIDSRVRQQMVSIITVLKSTGLTL